MKRFKVAVTMTVAVIALLTWGAPQVFNKLANAKPRYVIDPVSQPRSLQIDVDALARSLREYGIWREEHDRNTFPTDMPKAGEPYNPVTGNRK